MHSGNVGNLGLGTTPNNEIAPDRGQCLDRGSHRDLTPYYHDRSHIAGVPPNQKMPHT